MKVLILNESNYRIPRKFIQKWVREAAAELKSVRVVKTWPAEVTLVFLNAAEMRKLNKKFRKKDYATDVLSFAGVLSSTGDTGSLGDLALCPELIVKQAAEHGLLLREEYGYMILHGILHLLGFDHERSKRHATEMFALQDGIFARLRKRR